MRIPGENQDQGSGSSHSNMCLGISFDVDVERRHVKHLKECCKTYLVEKPK
jgi:hypothetical protein